ncbi:hypothetical protein As57867_006548, partial [Aphanomyces stellatus]
MMNKTVDVGMEKAKIEALASYAYCILRLEESMTARMISRSHDTSQITYLSHGKDDQKPNPIFREHVPKTQLQLSDDQEASFAAYAKKMPEFVKHINGIEVSITVELDQFKEALDDSRFQDGVKLINEVRSNIDKHFKSTKRNCGYQIDWALDEL